MTCEIRSVCRNYAILIRISFAYFFPRANRTIVLVVVDSGGFVTLDRIACGPELNSMSVHLVDPKPIVVTPAAITAA